MEKDRAPDDPEPPEVKSWKEARQFINKMKVEAQRKIEFEIAEVERKKLVEKEQHVRYVLSRSQRPGGLCKPQPSDTTSSEDDQTDDHADWSDGKGFEEVKRRDVKKKRKKISSIIKMKSPRRQVVAPKKSNTSPRKSPEVIKETNKPVPPKSPEPVFTTATPQSSPYHPDIGESNGTVLGDGSCEEKDTTEDDDFQEARSQEGEKSPSQEEEDPTMTTDKDMAETIPDSYPPPGQPNQPQTAPLQMTQEASYSSLLQSSQKPWTDQMDEVDPPDNGK